jgi:hypothetical protein
VKLVTNFQTRAVDAKKPAIIHPLFSCSPGSSQSWIFFLQELARLAQW